MYFEFKTGIIVFLNNSWLMRPFLPNQKYFSYLKLSRFQNRYCDYHLMLQNTEILFLSDDITFKSYLRVSWGKQSTLYTLSENP